MPRQLHGGVQGTSEMAFIGAMPLGRLARTGARGALAFDDGSGIAVSTESEALAEARGWEGMALCYDVLSINATIYLYYWYQNDHLGTPQKLIKSSGQVVWGGSYDTFGNFEADIDNLINNLRFPGQYHDSETGFYYNWNRYFDSIAGRYIQTDLIMPRNNLYEYASGNPSRYFDPVGLCEREKKTSEDNFSMPIVSTIHAEEDPSQSVWSTIKDLIKVPKVIVVETIKVSARSVGKLVNAASAAWGMFKSSKSEPVEAMSSEEKRVEYYDKIISTDNKFSVMLERHGIIWSNMSDEEKTQSLVDVYAVMSFEGGWNKYMARPVLESFAP